VNLFCYLKREIIMAYEASPSGRSQKIPARQAEPSRLWEQSAFFRCIRVFRDNLGSLMLECHLINAS
jgi:hypothetical protein